MSHKTSTIVSYFFVFAVVGGLIWIGLYNFNTNSKFWEMSFFNIVTIIVAVCVSFYLTQRFSDIRKKKDIFQKVLEDIQSIVGSSDAYLIEDNTEKESLLMRLRGLNLKLATAKKCASFLGVEKEIDYLSSTFKEYETLISDHISDLNYLKHSRKELQRPLDIIYNHIYEVLLKLY